MMMMNNNLLPAKKNIVALDINRNKQAKKTFKLRHIFNLNRRCKGVRSVNVTSDNRYLIITFERTNPSIRVVDLEKLEFLPHKYTGHTDSVRLTSITRDNKAFYTASWDGSSRRFEIASGNCTQILSGFGRSPSCFLDSEQKYLFTASYDSDFDLKSNNAGRCWDLSSGNTIKIYKHTHKRSNPESMDIAYDEGRVYTGSDDGYAYQWNVRGRKPLLKYFAFKGSVRKVAISSNYFAAACTDGLVRVHNKLSGKRFRYFFHGKTDVRDARISKDETKLWSVAENGSISCFNLMTGELKYHRKLHSDWIWSTCLMSEEKILVTGSSDGSITFLSADSGQIIAQLLNFPWNNDFLIKCPPDKVFPTGFFYTTNKDFIQVVMGNKKRRIHEKLDLDDPRREAYINKLNLKNLIITRLKSNGHYTSLTEKYIRNQKILNQACDQKSPRLLSA